MLTFRRWLKSQLAWLNSLESGPISEPEFDDVASMIQEAGRRAAEAGTPAAVRLCDIRRGPLAPTVAREILAGCIAAVPKPPATKDQKPADRDRLTPPQVAKQLGVSADTVRAWIASGELKAANVAGPGKRASHRITADALADFERTRTKTADPTPRRRKKAVSGLLVKRY